MEDCRLILGDSLAVLPTLEAGSIDAVVTDPPYGLGLMIVRNRTGPRVQERYRTMRGDEDSETGKRALAWAAERGLVTLAFAHPMRPWPGVWRQWLVWDKGPGVGGLGNYKRTWKQTWELIQVARNDDLRGRRDGAVLHFPVRPGTKVHPAEKPVALMRYLIEKLTKPGARVLDPFMGSGSTGVACLQAGRRFIGIEVDPEYFAVAERRLAGKRPGLTIDGPLFATAGGGP